MKELKKQVLSIFYKSLKIDNHRLRITNNIFEKLITKQGFTLKESEDDKNQHFKHQYFQQIYNKAVEIGEKDNPKFIDAYEKLIKQTVREIDLIERQMIGLIANNKQIKADIYEATSKLS